MAPRVQGAEADGSAIQRRWDLWNLKTLFPHWGERELDSLLATGVRLDRRQDRLFADPVAAAKIHWPRAAQVMADHPDLANGLTISLHLGPYSLAPIPWLASGMNLHVLVNRASLAGIRPVYESIQRELGLPGAIRWISVEGDRFALKLWRALRRNEPVFAFLDGNDGLGGGEGTLRQGLVHHLPGRDIRVRTGLARLALRLKCPVHSVLTVWHEADSFDWVRGPTWRWPPGTSVSQATGDMYEWCFEVVRRHPAQWRAWNMLTSVYDSFGPDDGPSSEAVTTAATVGDAQRLDSPLEWRKEVSWWPGVMLEDVRAECFYDGCGMSRHDLKVLQQHSTFTPREVLRWFGAAWLQLHLVRLVALGFVAFASREDGD